MMNKDAKNGHQTVINSSSTFIPFCPHGAAFKEDLQPPFSSFPDLTSTTSNMETATIVFLGRDNDSRTFFIDDSTSVSTLKAHIVDAFGLDKDTLLSLKTLDESVTLENDDDLQLVRSQIEPDDFLLLSSFIIAFLLLPLPLS